MSVATLFLAPWMGRSAKASPTTTTQHHVIFASVMTFATAAAVYCHKHHFDCSSLWHGIRACLTGDSREKTSTRSQGETKNAKTRNRGCLSRGLLSFLSRNEHDLLDDEWSHTSSTTASSEEEGEGDCRENDYIISSDPRNQTDMKKAPRTDAQNIIQKRPSPLSAIVAGLFGALLFCFLLFIAAQKQRRIVSASSRNQSISHAEVVFRQRRDDTLPYQRTRRNYFASRRVDDVT